MARQAAFSILFVLAGIALAPIRIGLLTRVLSEAEYGIFNLLTLTAASIGFVALLGQRQYLIFMLPGKTPRARGAHVYSALAVTAISGLLFALAFGGACRVFPALREAFHGQLVLAGVLFIALYAVAHFGMGYLLASGEVVRYRLQVFLTSHVWLVVLIPLLIWSRPSLGQLAWLWLAGLAVPMVWIYRQLLHSLGDGIHARPALALMGESARYGIPLITRNIATSLMRLVDRYVILRFINATQMGLYTVPITLVTYAADTTAFLEFFYPHISARWQANRAAGRPGCSGEAADYFHQALRIALLASAPMAIGILLWGNALVRILAGDSYASVSFLFAVLVGQVVLIPLAGFFHFAMMLDGRTPAIGGTIMVSTAANIALNLALVPRMDLSGAALAGTLSYLVLAASSLWASRLLPHLHWRKLQTAPLAASCAAMAAAVLAARRSLGANLAWEIPLAAVVFLAAGFLFRAWTLAEIRGLLHRGGREPARPA